MFLLLLLLTLYLTKPTNATPPLPPTKIPSLTLHNGVQMPQLALGTAFMATKNEHPTHPNFAGLLPEQAYRPVSAALLAGIRHLDTALVYRTHTPIAQILASFMADGGTMSREDVFLTSKICHGPTHGFSTEETCINWDELTPNEFSKRVKRDFQRCLEELRVGYVDLMLLHWPAAFHSQDGRNPARRLAAWLVLEECYNKGWARAIGVCNFNEHHLAELVESEETAVVPMVNQLETSVFLQYDTIIEYCKTHGIVVQAYSPLGRGVNHVTSHPTVVGMAEKYGRDAGQIALRFLVQKGYAVTMLTKSVDRLKSNQDIFDWVLEEEDMKALGLLKRVDGSWGLPSPYDMS